MSNFPLEDEVEFDILETALVNESARLNLAGEREDAQTAAAMVARLDMLRLGL